MSHMRVGVVTEQDVSGCRVRVRFPDRDQLTSWWLPIVVAKTQDDKAYHLPDLGEQVVCLMDAHDEDGFVLGAIYSSADTTAAGMTADKLNWTSKDGASLEYDRAEHQLNVTIPSGGSVKIATGEASIVIDTSGDVTVSTGGDATVSAAAINLGAAAVQGVARLGDTVKCPAGIGTIQSASTIVRAA